MLIVLGIIGLIADMTIPTLIAETETKIASARLQKVYSTLENAYRLAVQEYGTPDNWDLKGYVSKEGAMNIVNIFTQYVRTLDVCGFEAGCFPEENYKKLNGTAEGKYSGNDRFASILLADGTAIGFAAVSPDCKGNTSSVEKDECFGINIDINGAKKPNQFGRDMFSFKGTKNGLFPNGLKGTSFDADKQCKITSTGYGCAAWVIYNGNMDYLKCNDLSWDGKKFCK